MIFPILGDYFWPYQTTCQYRNTSQMADKNNWTNHFHFLLVIVIYITMHFSIICNLFFLSDKTDLFHEVFNSNYAVFYQDNNVTLQILNPQIITPN